MCTSCMRWIALFPVWLIHAEAETWRHAPKEPSRRVVDAGIDAPMPASAVEHGVMDPHAASDLMLESDDVCDGDSQEECALRFLQLRGRLVMAAAEPLHHIAASPVGGGGGSPTSATNLPPSGAGTSVAVADVANATRSSALLALAGRCRDLAASSASALHTRALRHFSLAMLATQDASGSAELVFLVSLFGVFTVICCGTCIAMSAMRVANTQTHGSPRGTRSDRLRDGDDFGDARARRMRLPGSDGRGRPWQRPPPPPRVPRSGGTCC
mmetsp:Transcript_40909/g.117516  ORF Transcript_40909/g.117516 Transcript_40909/m.117516 type:complete len:270 (+) Transcript_40909:144-953(+)